jgi:hypothetical protein
MRWKESIWDDLKKQIYLGSDEFVDEMQELSLKDQGLDDIPREQVSGVKRKMEEFLSYSDKREGMARAYLEEHYTLKEIGRAFGVHATTVSRVVKIWEDKIL